MSKIYANGYVFPTLPAECGSTEYPYFYIALSGSHFYLFALSAKGSINVENPLLYQISEDITVKYIMWVTAYNNSKVEALQESYPGITATDWMLEPTLNGSYSNTFPTNGKIKWSNHDITYSDETPYMTGSTSTDLNLICGDDATWDYDNDDTLIISGTGSTYDYIWEEENYPWSVLKEKIQYIKINEGITRLGNANFHGLINLSYVTSSHFPDTTLQEIGHRCFGACHKMSSINLPDTVKIIGDFCFGECYGLTYFDIPSSLQELGNNVFQATSHLQYFDIRNGNNNFTISNRALFNQNLTIIIHLPSDSSYQSYTIPEGVITIDSSCFYGHNHLQEIICPSSLEEIKFAAFDRINTLKNIIIPANVSFLGSLAFSNNNNLKWIKLLSAVPFDINNDSITLDTCPNLTRIYVPVGCAETYKSAEGWSAYSHLIYETKSIEFDLNKWISGFVYGLTGQPLPLPYGKLKIEQLQDVLYITNMNNVIIEPNSIIKIL